MLGRMMPNLNGTPPALPGSPRAGPPRSSSTEFLPDLPARSWRGWFYELSRHRMSALPLSRLLIGALLLLALVWGLGKLPGGWWVALVWLAVMSLFVAFGAFAARDQYITFQCHPVDLPIPAPLPPDAKVPLYATGWFSVESRERAFTNLPGFYRTFATREHALLCQLRPRRLLGLGALPDDEPGLWYAFFTPAQITRLQTGVLIAGSSHLSALAITYVAPQTKRRRQRTITLHLAFPNPADRLIVLADLLADQAVHNLPINS